MTSKRPRPPGPADLNHGGGGSSGEEGEGDDDGDDGEGAAPGAVGGLGSGAGTDAQRQHVAPMAVRYLQLARLHPPPLFEYARRHVGYFLQRRGVGARTYYRLAGPLRTQEVRALLTSASSIRWV